jgi:TetR/AcrR family fatty acid metabolism transcriptional regulator
VKVRTTRQTLRKHRALQTDAPTLRPRSTRSRKRNREVVGEFVARGIMSAGYRLILAKGYDSTSVEEIADAVGIAKGTIYLYYRSKREICRAVLLSALATLFDETARKMQAARDVRQALSIFVKTHCEWCESHRELILITPALPRGGMRTDPEFARLHAQQLEVLSAALIGGVRDGVLRDIDTARTAALIFQVPAGLYREGLFSGRGTHPEDVDNAVEVIWRGIAAPR